MIKIDSHQHFWHFDFVRHSWIDHTMQVIQRDFMPADLEPVLKEYNINGCIAVQVDQTQVETKFLLELAEQHKFIKGVVGWVDLTSGDIEAQLCILSKHKKIKGFRHNLQAEPNRALMLNKKFLNGIKALKEYDFTYDILIYPDQLKYIPEFVSSNRDQRFVIDHIAKPGIKYNLIDQWAADISKLSVFENVYCKISGMITEANWNNIKADDFTPYLDIVINVFGTDRIMYGSDWPVCNVAGGYNQVHHLVSSYITKLSDIEQEKFWGLNAIEFYRL